MDANQIQENLQVAVSLQAGQQVDDAAKIYEAILQVSHEQPDALHLLGLIESQKGRHENAVKMLGRATELVPDSASIWSNYGVVLRVANRIEEALSAYERSLELDPQQPDSHFNYGKALKLAGQQRKAEMAFKQALNIDPRRVAPWLSLINLAVDVGKPDTALLLASKALGHCPENPEILLATGVVLKREKRWDEAIGYFERVLGIDPKHVEALCKLASINISRQQIDEAREKLAIAQSVEPDHLQVLTTVGVLSNTLGDAVHAEQVLRRGVQVHPQNGAIHSNLGIALKKLGRLSEALQMMVRGIQLDSKNQESLINIAGAHLALGNIREAQECLTKVIEVQKGSKDAHDSLLMAMQYDSLATPERILAEHKRWDECYAQPVRESPAAVFSARDETKPLRVGFVSADVGLHPVGYFSADLFEHFDPNRFKMFIYSDRVGRDELAANIEDHVHAYVDVGALSDLELTQRIRNDRIDVLVDLAGHTAQNRLLVFARRGAPIQISWAGYVGTTGLAEMDFLLGDGYHLPPGCEEKYSESLLRMPNGYVTFRQPEDSPSVSELPASSNGFVTFASMCNPAKVNSLVLDRWREILESCSGSRLMLVYSGWDDPGNQRRVQSALGTKVQAERLEFCACESPSEVLKFYRKVDLALDTFPYSGGLTTCEALWMGVPTITFPGDTFASRHSFSHLSNVGLQSFVARNPDEYVAKAIAIANDPLSLGTVRKELREKMKASPLCGGEQFARDFGDLLTRICKNRL